MLFLVFLILGLIVGSFLSSLTYALSRPDFSWQSLWRRSQCPKCGQTIAWYDNIPLLSYIFLRGRCRSCGKRISSRYPAIEATTGVVFVLVGWKLFGSGQGWLGAWTLPFFLVVVTILLAIAIVDLEYQIIPDGLLVPLLIFNFSLLIFLSPSPTLFVHFAWGMFGGTFLLFINWVTAGRGMGLGDVKLALLLGLVAGQLTWVVFFLAFVIGGIVGLVLVVLKKAQFARPIAFGPFLILGTFLTLLYGQEIVTLLGMR